MSLIQRALVASLAALACAEGEKSTVSPEAVAAVREWYTEWPIGGGWKTTTVRAEGRKILVGFVIPEATARSFMAMPPARQLPMIAGIACPSKIEPLWATLKPIEDIELQVGDQGGVFADVSCRKWGE